MKDHILIMKDHMMIMNDHMLIMKDHILIMKDHMNADHGLKKFKCPNCDKGSYAD